MAGVLLIILGNLNIEQEGSRWTAKLLNDIVMVVIFLVVVINVVLNVFIDTAEGK